MLYNEKVDILSIGCVSQELTEWNSLYRELGGLKGLFNQQQLEHLDR